MAEQPVNTSTRLRILKQHAHGGLGLVSVAVDESLHREVAFKEILPEYAMHTASRERFVREAEITGSLEHPGVVPVYGVGEYSDGRPFYAMRFIKGESLSDAIAAFHLVDATNSQAGQRSLALRKLLGRFLDVCHAVDYAHNRGVLHRDLKPDNVMLGDFGETLVVDWGLAKSFAQKDDSPQKEAQREKTREEMLIETNVGDGSHETRMGSVIGTPAFMSPEQAAGQIDKLSPATDIYALGGTLFMLLTGHQPVEKSSQDEMLAMIISGNIPRPRDVFSSVPKSLDAICQKAMALDPQDRYPTVDKLADDLEHWLADEPVVAYSESWFERAARWTRRYRMFVLSATISLALITAVSVVASVLINQQRNRAENLANDNYQLALQEKSAHEEAETRRQEAESAQEKESQARHEAEAVVGFMINAFQSPDPARDGRDIKAAELLDRAMESVETNLADQPLVQAAFFHASGDSYLGLGLPKDAIEAYDKAVAIRRPAIGEDNLETLASVTNLSLAYLADGQSDKAVPLLEQTLKFHRAAREGSHEETIKAMSNLAMAYQRTGNLDAALPIIEESLALAENLFGPADPITLDAASNLATTLQSLGKMDGVIPLLENTLERSRKAYGKGHVKSLAVANNLAQALNAVGKPKEALALLASLLEESREKLGDNHPNTLTHMNNLAGAYQANGDYDKALALYKSSLHLTRERLGADHPSTLISMNNLANAYQTTNQVDKALPLLEETLKQFQKILGDDHPSTLIGMSNLGRTYQAAGKLDEAVAIYEETVEKMSVKLGEDHPRTLIAMNNLALAIQANGRLDDAMLMLEKTLRLMLAKHGREHPSTIAAMNCLAMTYVQSDDLPKALPLLEESVALAIDVQGIDHPHTRVFMQRLASAYESDGRPEKAVAMYQEAGLEEEAALWQAKGVDRPSEESPADKPAN